MPGTIISISGALALVLSGCVQHGTDGPLNPVEVPPTKIELLHSDSFSTSFAPSTVRLLVAQDGIILASDRVNHAIEVLSPDSGRPSFVGSRGIGPGEFESIDSARLGPLDSLFVVDHRSGRVSVFAPTPSLGFAYAFRPVVGRSGISTSVFPGHDGELLAVIEPWEYGASAKTRVATIDRSGRVVRDSVLVLPRELFHVTTFSGGESHVRVPFSHRPFAEYLKKGLLVAASSDHNYVRVIDSQGIQRQLALGLERARVLESDVEAARNELRRTSGGVVRLRVFDEADIPDRHPFWEEMIADRELATLWFRLRTEAVEEQRWVFVAENRTTGSVLLPAGRHLKQVSGGLLYAVVGEDGDVLLLETYRLLSHR